MQETQCPDVNRRFSPLLLAWFDRHRRDLPWRQTRDPYCIWVSEVMLQQTQVAKVTPYYQRFLQAYPSVSALAAAPIDEVLRLWEGLGYYARAQQLHRAAAIVLADYGGYLPHTRAELLRLPGIGPYTAGAILSIAFGAAEPAVDTNALRVLVRVFWLFPGTGAAEQEREARIAAAAVLSPGRPGDHNQALMDLAAQVCTPTLPSCSDCPLGALCQAYQRGKPEAGPQSRRPPPRAVRSAAALVWYGRRLLLARRPLQGIWRGLWELPNCECPPGEAPEGLLRDLLQESLGLQVRVGEPLHTLRYGIMNRRVTLTVYGGRATRQAVDCRDHLEARWVPAGEVDRYALPAPHRRVLQAILSP